MNEVWNLDPIYQGFDDPAFARDVEALQLTLSQLEAFVKTLGEADPAQGLRRGLELQEALAGSPAAAPFPLPDEEDSAEPDGEKS